MMHLQTMSHECQLQFDSQFAEDRCNHMEDHTANTNLASPNTFQQSSPAQTLDISNSEELNNENYECDLLDKSKHLLAHSEKGEDDLSNENNIPPNLDETDDFCEFESYAESNGHAVENSIHDVDFANFDSLMPMENFANFDSSNLTLEPIDNCQNGTESDEEFADFKSASNDKSTNLPIQKCETKTDTSSSDFAGLFKSTFPDLPQTRDSIIEKDLTLPSAKGEIFDQGSQQSQILWTSLQSMDLKSICLHNWKDSLSFKRLLQALKVSNSNILSDIYSSKYDQILEPTAANWTNSMKYNASSSLTENTIKIKVNSATSSLDHDFQPTLRLNQDLDFFESKYSNKNDKEGTKDNLISEFENIILDNNSINSAQESEVPSSLASPASSANDLRRMLKDSFVKPNNEQVLSAEALQILDELPNLSFIRAKVLMFPINDKNSI